MSSGPHIWLFVRVIDNYGDLGVAWRLACDLRQRLHARVWLWSDDTTLLHALAPAYTDEAAITVLPWRDEATSAAQLADLPPADLVIETFGCELPAAVRARIRQDGPLWLNWEYLSAEDWTAAVHALPSLQADGSAKFFWLMGFDAHSGGLLREVGYSAARNAFEHDTAAQQAFKRRYGLPENPHGPNWLLFAYDHPRWADWLQMWRHAGRPLTLWLAGEQIMASLHRAGILGPNDLVTEGSHLYWHTLRLCRLPFVPQAEFDHLLFLAEGAIVRGEDSFVRAQWAGLPFWWHIYPQQQQAHLAKLHAFWQRAAQDWPAPLRQAHQALSQDLNGGDDLTPTARLAAWQTLHAHASHWRQHSHAWSHTLHAQSSAVERLALFMQNRLK